MRHEEGILDPEAGFWSPKNRPLNDMEERKTFSLFGPQFPTWQTLKRS